MNLNQNHHKIITSTETFVQLYLGIEQNLSENMQLFRYLDSISIKKNKISVDMAVVIAAGHIYYYAS